jgi:hypothetical protein
MFQEYHYLLGIVHKTMTLPWNYNSETFLKHYICHLNHTQIFQILVFNQMMGGMIFGIKKIGD